MKYSSTCSYWSILQVVAIVLCYRGKVSSSIREIAQGCVGSQLGLECPEMKVISVTSVVLGNSKCLATLTSCCIKDNDCTHRPNEQHATEVRRRCDGKRNCTFGVLKEKIPCGYVAWSYNDFERITYDCIYDPNNGTTNSTDEQDDDGDDHEPDEEDKETQTQIHTNTEQIGKDGQPDNRSIVTTIAVCTIVLIAIIVLVSIVLFRRKRRQRLKSSATVKTSDADNARKELIYMNVTQETRQNEDAGSSLPIYSNHNSKDVRKSETSTIDYCELEGATAERSQATGEGAYEHLNNSRNYEPLNFYEQLQ